MPKAIVPRNSTDRTAQRSKLDRLFVGLGTDQVDLEQALAALPVPASRTAAQKRDAAMIRSQLRVVKLLRIVLGTSTAADLNDETA